MSFWATALGFLRGGRISNPETGVQSDGSGTQSTEADIIVTDDRALGVTAFWACVGLITKSGVSLPLPLYTKNADGSREKVTDDNHYSRLLRWNPNGYMNGREFLAALWTQRVIYGNAYAHIRRRGDGQVSSMIPLQPDSITVCREDDGIKFKQSVTNGGTKEYWNRNGQPREILHWRGFSTDGIIGFSPIDYARDMLGVTVSAEQYAAKSFTGRPNAIMKAPTFLSDKQRQQAKALYDDINGASVLKGNTWLLEGGFDYHNTNDTPDDLQMLESRGFQVSEVCRLFNVPSVMVDGSEKAASWPASYEQHVLAFLRFTLQPYLIELADKLQECILPAGVYAEHNVEALLRADSKARANFYSTALQNGWMSRAEVRQKENLPPKDGTDDLTVQVNLTLAELLGQERNDATE